MRILIIIGLTVLAVYLLARLALLALVAFIGRGEAP
jgi:hypothetical protein